MIKQDPSHPDVLNRSELESCLRFSFEPERTKAEYPEELGRIPAKLFEEERSFCESAIAIAGAPLLESPAQALIRGCGEIQQLAPKLCSNLAVFIPHFSDYVFFFPSDEIMIIG